MTADRAAGIDGFGGSKLLMLAAGAAGIAVVGLVDFLTGPEISVALFYLIPIVFVSWFVDRFTGVIMAVLAGGVWAAVEAHAGRHSSRAVLVWNSITRLLVFVTVAVLMTGLRKAYDHERLWGRTDPLTGAANPREFRRTLAENLYRTRRYRRPFTLAYGDLDGFKSINDRYGHTAGDHVLTSVVRELTASVRAIDLVARLGGDEFAVILPETDADGAHAAVDHITKRLRDAQLPNMSMGVVTFWTALESPEEAVKAADRLMYLAKQQRPGTACFDVVGGGRTPLLDER